MIKLFIFLIQYLHTQKNDIYIYIYIYIYVCVKTHNMCLHLFIIGNFYL